LDEAGSAQDGPFWALNLMRYRELADYADGRETTLTGREADDLYAPLGPLAAIGALPVFLADVTDQPTGAPLWERVAIVRYPSRSAFLAMQQREDFRELHAHKDAGMQTTIVMSCLPTASRRAERDGTRTADGALVLTVRRAQDPLDASALEHAGVHQLVRFDVEGVIVGDERTWTEARLDVAADRHGHEALAAAAASAEEAVVMTVEPALDDLLGSIAGTSACAST